jgi:predicted dehydrogenase
MKDEWVLWQPVEVRIPWWRGQDYYDQDGRGTLSRDGGGVLITQAIHTLDIMLLLCGPIKEVQGMIYTSSLAQTRGGGFFRSFIEFPVWCARDINGFNDPFPGL